VIWKFLCKKKGTFHGFLDSVQVTWLHYPYPLVGPLIETNRYDFKIASPVDIGVMKLVAVSQRGAKKDLIDLYLLEKNGILLSELIKLLPKKFPQATINYYHIIKSLVYFSDADREPMPKMFSLVDWDEIKKFFLSRQEEFLSLI
jgi:hypothetical protein